MKNQPQENSQEKEKPAFVILLFLSAFPAASATLFTPALPAITSYFQIPENWADLTISIFFLGYAFAQIPYGPLANRLGRKKTLYLGLSIALIGNLLCALSSFVFSFALLVCARFLQAVGAAVGLKISYTMIADTYDQTMATRMLSRLGMSFAIVSAFGLTIGGYITQGLSWEWCFYFLAVCNLALLFAATRLSETTKELDKEALHPKKMLQEYILAFRTKRLPVCGMIMGCVTAIIYLFNAKAPFVGIEHIGLTPDAFGAYSAIPLGGTLIGAVLADRLAGKFSLTRLSFIGVTIAIIGAICMFLEFFLGHASVASLFLPTFFIYIVESVIFANSLSLGLSKVTSKAHGAAMLNFISFSTVFGACYLVGTMTVIPEIILPLSFLFLLIVVFLLTMRLRERPSLEE